MTAFFHRLTEINDVVGHLVWGTPGLLLLLGTGVLITCLTKGFQLVHMNHWLRHTAGSFVGGKTRRHGDAGAISQFQALCTALAATLGIGNIAGVAAAILSGGPGAIFWMWIAALFGMMTGYAEKVLGLYYRRRVNGEWAGGAMYYLRDGLGSKKGCRTLGRVLAWLFAFCCVLASFGIGNISQVSLIVTNIEAAFPFPALSGIRLYEDVSLYALLIAAVLLAAAAPIILGGLQRLAVVTEKIVPFMVLLYIGGALFIISSNAGRLGEAFEAIFGGAFTGKAAWGGTVGITLQQVITWGFKRGVFSNEAGLGSSVLVHASSDAIEPVHQGMWGIFEVFIDTIVVCTITALAVLTSGVIDLRTGVFTGHADPVAAAFCTRFGLLGEQFIAVAVLLFAFASVLGWSQYGVKAAEYLGGRCAVRVYKVVFVLLIVSGGLLTSSLAWELSDTFNGLMMLPNLIGVIALCGTVKRITDNYIERQLRHKPIPPLLSYDPRLQRQMERKEKAK